MRVVKISTIIISFIFFINVSIAAEKIYCRKFSAVYKEYTISVLFSQNGKMVISVDDKDSGGYFSTPGSYLIKDSKVDFFYRGLSRTIHLKNDSITATPYTFNIEDDYRTEIVLHEDKSYSSSCKK